MVVSGDITERFVTAGYGWDRVLQYHSKVGENYNAANSRCRREH